MRSALLALVALTGCMYDFSSVGASSRQSEQAAAPPMQPPVDGSADDVADAPSMADEDSVFLAGMTRTAAARAWRRVASSARWSLLAIAGVGDDWTAVGACGAIVRRDEGGVAVEQAPTSRALRAIVETQHGVLAVGDRGTLLERRDATWSRVALPTSVDLYAATENLIVGGAGIILERSAAGWQEHAASGCHDDVTFTGIVASQGDIYLAGADSLDHGVILQLAGDALAAHPATAGALLHLADDPSGVLLLERTAQPAGGNLWRRDHDGRLTLVDAADTVTAFCNTAAGLWLARVDDEGTSHILRMRGAQTRVEWSGRAALLRAFLCTVDGPRAAVGEDGLILERDPGGGGEAEDGADERDVR